MTALFGRRTRWFPSFFWAVLPLSLLPPAAQAQPADEGIANIVVTAERPAVETSIDRKSYALGADLQATTGSAADVMRNLPSISVDLDGNPSLRGDANVLILIDGQSAPMLNTANRGAALQQMGADTIDRIEVMTNPPANFKQDGAAGVINIITKRNYTGRAATLQASVGSGGRFNVGGTGNYRLGALGVHGALTLRRDIRNRTSTEDRIVSSSDAPASASKQRIATANDRLSRVATLGADVDVSANDRFSTEGTYNYRTDDQKSHEDSLALDASDTPVSLYQREQRGKERRTSTSALVKYHHSVGKDGDGLTILAQRSETAATSRRRFENLYEIPALLPSFDHRDSDNDEVTRELSLEYKVSLQPKAKFTVGYNLKRDDSSYDNIAASMATAMAPLVTDPNFTNKFVYGQTVHAFYGSYERTVSSWTVQGGLRLEQTNRQTDQVTSGLRASDAYFRVYPNVHVIDQLSDAQSVSFSYGRRVRRPDTDDLNPYAYQRDAFTIRQGNPRLLPEDIHSFELGWAYEKGSATRSATLFLRKSTNRATVVASQLTPTLQLITEENLGRSTSAGLDLAGAGKIFGHIDYNLSGSVFYNRIDAGNLGFADLRSTFSYEGKAALNWRATDKDTFQVNFAFVGKRLQPQGYRPAYTALDLGFRHQFPNAMALTATISDILQSRKDGVIIATPSLTDNLIRRQAGRVVLVGLSWTLSSIKSKAPSKFEYEN